ncbi:protein trapped in endoderm-1-like [Apostichopus japonicus]|uniref:protein trapped in endoderm-1-like n=1 Tax=Stichopus japonicus TaxID=307972 RepID=UPI003AB7499C
MDSYHSMNESNYITPNTNARITGVANGVFFFVGIIGNGLVILAVISSKKLQTSTNTFIVNLAVTDVLTSLTLPIYVVVKWINFYSPRLETVCQILPPVATTSIGCSFLTVAAIAINRYTLIASPYRIYPALFRAKMNILWITLLWVISASVVILPPYVFDFGKFGFGRDEHNCISVPEHPSTKLYALLVVAVFYPLPLLAIVVCYVGIFIRLFAHNRRLNANRCHLRTQRTSPGRLTTTNDSFDIETRNGKKTHAQSFITPVQIQVTKNMFIIFIALVVCFTPHTVCSILQECAIEEYTRTIAAANSIINPIIYGFKHPVFREVFTALIKRQDVPQPSSMWSSIKKKRVMEQTGNTSL